MTKPLKSTGNAFDQLIRRLAQVPKAGLEDEEQKWRQQRERLRKKGAAKAKRKRKA